MTTKQQHSCAEILRAIADGEIIQLKTTYGDWVDISDSYAMLCMGCNCELRIKPRTIKIGEYEVPESLREAPYCGMKYYIIDLANKHLYECLEWRGNNFDRESLRRGLIHSTPESAIIHAKALISVSEKK